MPIACLPIVLVYRLARANLSWMRRQRVFTVLLGGKEAPEQNMNEVLAAPGKSKDGRRRGAFLR